jgi:5-methylcytosine-specific restriction endonuclease McrA
MLKGTKMSDAARAKMRAAWVIRTDRQPRLGKKHSLESRARISETTRKNTPRGAKCHSFKDGKLSERRGERFSTEYKRWRYSVFLRDGFTCQRCGDDRGGNLIAHHIMSFSQRADLRYVVSNGETLCSKCHKAHHNRHGYG